MWNALFWTLVAIDVALSVYCVWQVRRDYLRHGTLTIFAAAAVWCAYLLHFALTAYAAWQSMWHISVNPWLAAGAGAIAVLAGAAMLAAAVYSFGSIQRMSGFEEDRLVTGGIYRYSRNPQNVGLLLILAGIAIAGRSAAAMALVFVFCIIIRLYLPIEERHLRRAFGEEYERYRAATPRLLGWPKSLESARRSQ